MAGWSVRWPQARRVTRWVFGVLAVVIGVIALAPASLLVVTARTVSGRLAGWSAVGAVALLFALSAMVRSANPRDARLLSLGLVGGVTFVCCLALLLVRVPKTTPPATTGLLSVFPDVAAYHPYSLWNLVPEVDSITLGAAILSRVDPWMSRNHARRIRATLNELYDEMEADPGNRTLGTVADHAVAELVGGTFRELTHYYAYVPAHGPEERLGLLIFLHGNAGNHKVSTWAWKPFADRYKFAIVSPTFGFGFWDAGGVEAVKRVYQHAIANLPVDRSRIWLGGISDGGKGVTRSATAHPEHYQGLIYLSPTLLPDEVASPRFLDAWKGRPAVVFQGEADHNVLKKDVDPAVAIMRQGGLDVTYHTFPGEDHFLFFARRGEIFEQIAARLIAGSVSNLAPERENKVN